MIGLVTDMGYMHFVMMTAQTAAEVAAKAAIIDMHATVGGAALTCASVTCASTPTACPTNITTPTNSIQRGCMYAQQHGFTGANQSVTYQAGVSGTPPTATGIGTASYWVTYRAVQTVPTMFSAILGNTSSTVVARSSAAIVGSSDCIYALSPSGTGIAITGSASMTSACGVYVDSTDPSALTTGGSSSLVAPEYDVAGGVSVHTPLSPNPNLGVSQISDPLASLPVPASAPYICDHINYSAPNWSNPTLTHGVYCGGIHVGNNSYTLSPGNYILVGGGLSTQSTNSTISGTGVMIYNTYNATYPYAPITLAANSTVSLKAPTAGTYAGILIFEDRTAPASSDTYGGGASAVYEGTIYAKNANITMSGNSNIAAYTLLVAATVSMVGSTNFSNNYASLPGGSPIQKTVMVE
jgi:hypothetical protein